MIVPTHYKKKYVVISTQLCTVTTSDGALICVAEPGKPASFVAPATSVQLSDDSAYITPVVVPKRRMGFGKHFDSVSMPDSHKYADCANVNDMQVINPNYLGDVSSGVWRFSLKSLENGDNAFASVIVLSDFLSDLPSLRSGRNMFVGCILSICSVKMIARSVPTVEAGVLTLGIDIRHKTSKELSEALQLLESKGWILEIQYNTPSDVTTLAELEYLESFTNQYILIPYPGSKSVGARAKFRQLSVPGGSVLSSYGGNQESLFSLTRFLSSYSRPTWSLGKFSYYYLQSPEMSYLGEIEAATNWFEDSSGSIFWDGKSSTVARENLSDTAAYSGFKVIEGEFALYWLKISDGQNIVHDFIPVLDETGEACLFDKVSRQYFRNAGTGTFGWSLKTSMLRLKARTSTVSLPHSPIWARLVNGKLEWCHYTSKITGWRQFATIEEAQMGLK